MNSVAVSIIVPIYNVEKYLKNTLESIARQSMCNIEVIMVNDGSTDGSAEIALEYCDKYDYFTLINRSNGGLSAARNTGIDAAKGEYIYFLDSDDFIEENAIEKLYKQCKEDDLDLLRFVAFSFNDGTTDYKWDKNSGYYYHGEYSGVYKGTDFYSMSVKNGDYYPSCCLIFAKRKILVDNDLRFLDGILHEDNIFNFQLTILCERVAVLNEPLYYRRIRNGSITQKPNWKKKNNSLCIMAEKTDAFIEQYNVSNIIGSLQMRMYVSQMILNWNRMSREDKKSEETSNHFERMKLLVDKYLNGGEKSIKLFYFNKTIYRAYFCCKMLINNIFAKKKG